MRTAVGAFSKSAKAGILYKDTLGMSALTIRRKWSCRRGILQRAIEQQPGQIPWDAAPIRSPFKLNASEPAAAMPRRHFV